MKALHLKTGSAFILQTVILLIGLAVLAFLLTEPHLEGRNAHATTFEIYFQDPFLAYVYAGSIPFFMALHRAFRLFGDVRRQGARAQETLNSLRTIKRCALSLLGFVAGGVVIILTFGDPDDRPAGIFMAGLVALAASLIAIVATAAMRKP